MGGDADLTVIGKMLGDEHRASFLVALLGGEELPAGELFLTFGIPTDQPLSEPASVASS